MQKQFYKRDPIKNNDKMNSSYNATDASFAKTRMYVVTVGLSARHTSETPVSCLLGGTRGKSVMDAS